MRKEDIKKLEAFEMWTWRKMEKISWTKRKTNEEVLEMIDEERKWRKTIRERQRKGIGHTPRGEILLRMVIEGKMEGKRTRGRPRQMMQDWMMVDGFQTLKEKAQRREEWRKKNSITIK